MSKPNAVLQLLETAYKREIELEELLEDTYLNPYKFTEQTKEFNVQIQIACLKYLEQQRRLEEFKPKLAN